MDAMLQALESPVADRKGETLHTGDDVLHGGKVYEVTGFAAEPFTAAQLVRLTNAYRPGGFTVPAAEVVKVVVE